MEVYTETESGNKPIGCYTITWPAAGPKGMNEQEPTNSPFIATVEILKECKGVSANTADENEKIYIIEVDLDIYNGGSDLDNGESAGSQGAAVADGDEESAGAYLLVNWDNDDGDSPPVPDLDESSVTNEDNLAKLVPDLDPSASTLQAGTVELEVTAGASKIKIWRSSTKGTELTLTASKKTWDLTNSSDRTDFSTACTSGLWIEGIDWSNERDIIIKLTYKASSQEIDSDTVKATAVMLHIGSGLYRELDKFPAPKAYGHTGMLMGYNGDCIAADFDDDTNYEVFDIHTVGCRNNLDLTEFTSKEGYDYWASYTCGSPSTTYTQRLKIIKSAKAISVENPIWVGDDVLVPKEGSWNGAISDIEQLRCDGVIEVAYEINDINVWGKGTEDPNYDIRVYLDEHNETDWPQWMRHLLAATQCGHTTPENAKTTFTEEDDVCLPTSLRD